MKKQHHLICIVASLLFWLVGCSAIQIKDTLVWLYAVRALFCPCGAGTSGQHGSNFIPGAAPRRPIQIYPKNLNGGKADGSYHQL